ncbi:hypothetical protein ACFOWZ_41620 [Lentzea rhizosphaerae]|uniref:Uncharacterized protein n=1 Tax=Lentzea rhizosphaerae TaxID=2041025 RepID=A0ABV8C7S4_9PSEU
MTTIDDIARRVEEADSARSARRTKAAQLVGELAHERVAVVQRLADIDQQIGDAIAENGDVIAVDELARFTGVSAADLAQILDSRKQSRGRRRKGGAGFPPGRRGRDRTADIPEPQKHVDSTAEDSFAVKETGTP